MGSPRRQSEEVEIFEEQEGRLPIFLAYKSLIPLITKDITERSRSMEMGRISE